MQYACIKWEMHTKISLKNFKGGDKLDDLCIDGKLTEFEVDLRKIGT
jgi:hypothetical protein